MSAMGERLALTENYVPIALMSRVVLAADEDKGDEGGESWPADPAECCETVVLKAGLKGLGLFSMQVLKEGDFITEYFGEYCSSAGQCSVQLSICGTGPNIFLDAGVCGERARFLNHSCCPNACLQELWCRRLRGSEDVLMPCVGVTSPEQLYC